MKTKFLSLFAVLILSAGLSIGSVQAAENPFGVSNADASQQIAMSTKCGGGKCGDGKKDGKCGGSGKDGKCGDGKKAAKDGDKKKGGKCGEGKCGEGKCGGK